MVKYYCKRCNKELTNKKSIELGYGKICYKLYQIEKQDNSLIDIINTVDFLKCEIKMIKFQLKQNKYNEPLNSFNKTKRSNPTIDNKSHKDMVNVINEMKELFISIKDVKEVLIHVEVK